jgi:PAS domain S-box-containing protein
MSNIVVNILSVIIFLPSETNRIVNESVMLFVIIILIAALIYLFIAMRKVKRNTRRLSVLNEKFKSELNGVKNEVIELKESELKFRLLFELSPLPIAITEYETGKFYDVNKKLCKLSGMMRDELIGKTSFELNFYSKETRIKIIEHLSTRNDDQGFEIDFNLKDGILRNCIIYPFMMSVKGTDMIITIISDITNIKETRREIRKLSTAIDQSANTIIITNNRGEIEFVNPYFTRLTGYEPADVIGKNPSIQKSGYHSAEFYKNLWVTILRGEKWIGEFYNKKKNGDLYWESSTISPITDEEGKITHFMAIKEDVTEKKLQQEALLISEKRLTELNATKDKFFSIIAHDLMNPFNALQGFGHLTADSVKQNDFEKSLKYITMVEQLTDRITLLFQNLLLWSRAQSGKINFQPEMTDVGELAKDTLVLLSHIAQKKNVEIKITIVKHIEAWLDQNMIGTVLRNLVQNAIKFSNMGSRIDVLIEELPEYVHFTIADQGIGINPEVVNELFKIDKLHSTKGTQDEAGTGLGLVICKEFVESHNGQIWAESELGRGSKFHFTIPKTL